MEFDRKERMKSVLTEVISAFIREEANTSPLITITNLNIATGLDEVKIYITTIPESGQGDALIFLKRKGSDLRNYVKKYARLKYIPHFEFEIDYGERHRQRIDQLSQEIQERKKK